VIWKELKFRSSTGSRLLRHITYSTLSPKVLPQFFLATPSSRAIALYMSYVDSVAPRPAHPAGQMVTAGTETSVAADSPKKAEERSGNLDEKEPKADIVVGITSELNRLHLDEGRIFRWDGSRTTHLSESLTPMARWLLQDVAQEPYSNIIHVKSSISRNEVTDPHEEVEETWSLDVAIGEHLHSS